MKSFKSIFKDRKLTIFVEIFKYLPIKYLYQFCLLILFLAVYSFVEMFSYACVALFASVINDPKIVLDSIYIKHLENTFIMPLINNQKYLIIIVGILVFLGIVVKNLMKGIETYYSSRFSTKIDGFIGEKILNGFLTMPYEWHLSKNSADLVIAVDWRRFIGSGIVKYGIQFLNNAILVLIMVFTLIFVSPYLSLSVILFMSIFSGIIFLIFRKSINEAGKKTVSTSESANREITKALHGYKEVKIYNRTKSFVNNYNIYAKKLVKHQSLQQLFINVPVMVLESLGFGILITIVIIMLSIMKFSTAEATGAIVLLAMLSWKILQAVSKLITVISQIQGHIPYADKSLKYLSEIENHKKDQDIKFRNSSDKMIFNNEILFKDVCFSYNGADKATLSNLNLKIPKGITVGIIGNSGSGKSTFVDVLLRLLELSKGNIFFDGVDIKNINSSAWLSLVGYVSQFPYICDGTLAENIAFGINPEEIDLQRVLECCKMAAVTEFLDRLPDGLNTKIGERGVKLSGGQRQRVAIARALYVEPEVMIFDEATSSLDTKSEKSIQETIYSFKGKKTLIVIAHRLSTVEDCDIIIWIENGKIEQIGIPDEVLPKYKERQ